LEKRRNGIFFNRRTACVLASAAGLLLAVLLEPSCAQQAVSSTPQAGVTAPASAEELKDLAARIENEQSRHQLLEQIRALIAVSQKTKPAPEEKPISERLAEAAGQAIEEASQGFTAVGRFFPNRRALMDWIQNQLSDPAKLSRMANRAWPVVLIFGVAWVSELFAARLLRRRRRRMEEGASAAVASRLPRMVGRTLLRLAAVAVFAVAALTAFFVLQPPGNLGKAALQAAAVYIAGRILLIAARMVLAPAVPSLRLLPIGSEAAASLFGWMRRLIAVALSGYLAGSLFLLFGLPPRGFSALMNILGFILLVLLIAFVLRHRSAVADWIRGPGDSSTRRFAVRLAFQRGLAAVWHLLAIGYLIGFYVVWWQSIPGGWLYLARGTLLSAVVLFFTWLVFQAIQHGGNRALAAGEQPREQFTRLKARAGVYLPWALNAARAAALLLAALSILEA